MELAAIVEHELSRMRGQVLGEEADKSARSVWEVQDEINAKLWVIWEESEETTITAKVEDILAALHTERAALVDSISHY